MATNKSTGKYSKKYTPSASQVAASAERRERMRKLARAVSSLTPEKRAEMFAAHPVLTIEGRPLSMFNTCFLVSQLKTVTVVGGFAQWRAAGRAVNKGERGLAIWIPMKRAKGSNDTREEGEISSQDLEDKTRFVLATVFDISQTAEIAEIA